MKKLLKLASIISLGVFYPLLTSAAPDLCVALSGLGKLLCKVQVLFNSALPVLVALGVVYFVWGVVQYVIGGGEEAKKKGRDHIVYGIIGLAVIIGLWGLVKILVVTFDVEKIAPDNKYLEGLLPS